MTKIRCKSSRTAIIDHKIESVKIEIINDSSTSANFCSPLPETNVKNHDKVDYINDYEYKNRSSNELENNFQYMTK